MEPLAIGAALGGASLLVGAWRRRHDFRPKTTFRVIGGMNFDTDLNFPDADENPPSGRYRYHWGQRWLDFQQLTQGGVVVGAPGSGKTVSLKLLMKGILPRIQRGERVRAVVYDSKTDLLPFLLAKGHIIDRSGKTDPDLAELRQELADQGIIGKTHGLRFDPACEMVSDESKIYILDPTDKRSRAWDISGDITDRFQIETLAAYLIPAPESLGQNRYFSEAAQRILAQVMLALHIACPGRWRLKDLIMICRSVELMKTLLYRSPATRPTIEEFFHEDTSFQSVRSTLSTAITGYESIALSWEPDFERRKFKTQDWIQDPGLLVLGNNHRAREPITKLNRMILAQLQAHVMDQESGKESETWFILDEFRELGKIEGFNEFLITCRGKKAAVIMGFQDIAGVEEVYGEKNAREILACANNAMIYFINGTNPHTQEWASKVMGQSIYEKLSLGVNKSKNGISRDVRKDEELRAFWKPSDFSTKLKMPSQCGQLNVAYSVAGFWGNRETHFDNLLHPKNSSEPRFIALDDPTVAAREKVDMAQLPMISTWESIDFARLQMPDLRTTYEHITGEGFEKTESAALRPELYDGIH